MRGTCVGMAVPWDTPCGIDFDEDVARVFHARFNRSVASAGNKDLFTAAVDNWSAERWLAQLGWMWTLGREGGLFFTIGRRAPERAAAV